MKNVLFILSLVVVSQMFAQTGPSITINNNLINCQIQVRLYQMNSDTMDCSTSELIIIETGLGVMSSQTLTPMPDHVFVRAEVAKGGGDWSCFYAIIEPDASPCDNLSISESEYFWQCCSSSVAGGTKVVWDGGMIAPEINIFND